MSNFPGYVISFCSLMLFRVEGAFVSTEIVDSKELCGFQFHLDTFLYKSFVFEAGVLLVVLFCKNLNIFSYEGGKRFNPSILWLTCRSRGSVYGVLLFCMAPFLTAQSATNLTALLCRNPQILEEW